MVHHKGKWINTYWKPTNAIVGQTISTNGKRHEEDRELKKVKEFLRRMKIPYRIRTSRSSNIGVMKRWIIIPSKYPLNQLEEQIIKQYVGNETTTFHE